MVFWAAGEERRNRRDKTPAQLVGRGIIDPLFPDQPCTDSILDSGPEHDRPKEGSACLPRHEGGAPHMRYGPRAASFLLGFPASGL